VFGRQGDRRAFLFYLFIEKTEEIGGEREREKMNYAS
jgi:hypothetical protein